jgi:6-phosphogluconolactonase
MSARWHSYSTGAEAAEACARHILARLEEALANDAQPTLAVSGGATPKLLFDELAKQKFEWGRVHLFFVDERHVPATDPQSNYLLAEKRLIAPARIPHRNVHRIQTELRPDMAARRYAEDIRQFFQLEPGEMPHFDVIHRGLGADAHTASLFPGDPLIEDREGIAAAAYVEKLAQWRITMLPGALLAAKHTVLLAVGEDKAEPLRNVLSGPYDPLKYPCQLVAHHGRGVIWFLDKAAARLIDGE